MTIDYRQYQLFLFDFDGVLVNTEPLHKEAYNRLAGRYGYRPSWTLQEYLGIAHRGGKSIQNYFYDHFPRLRDKAPDWKELYALKCAFYLEVVAEGGITLMPGVEQFLETLRQQDAQCVVVTHSRRVQTELIRTQLPALNRIQHWITREDYEKAKPDPEPYLTAIARFGKEGDQIVGFEDSWRGLRALAASPAQAVLVCDPTYPLREEALEHDAVHIPSFTVLLDR